jgi:SAM-dependent methyltransferase
MKLSKKPSGGAKKGKGKKSGSGGRSAAGDLEFDYSYLDDHHKSVLVSCLLAPHIIINAAKVTANLNEKKQVMRELERSISGLKLGSSGCEERPVVGLVVGLGGGAMPMVLQRYLPGLKLYVCELDGEMEAVATKHFGFKCSSKCSVIINEGMQLIHSLASSLASSPEGATPEPAVPITEQLDFMFIDVDSKDPSLGMSAPPQSFVTAEALSSMYKVLRPGGLLVVNVAARVKSLLLDLAQALKSVW